MIGFRVLCSLVDVLLTYDTLPFGANWRGFLVYLSEVRAGGGESFSVMGVCAVVGRGS